MRLVMAALILFAAPAPAGPALAGDVTLTGQILNPRSISMAELAAMPSETIQVSQATDHGAAGGSYTGVLIWSLVSFKNGPEKNAYLRHTLLISSGDDGYAAALSEGEIDPKLGGAHALIAYKKDGAMLTAPQLVVPGDAHAARSVKAVSTIVVQ